MTDLEKKNFGGWAEYEIMEKKVELWRRWLEMAGVQVVVSLSSDFVAYLEGMELAKLEDGRYRWQLSLGSVGSDGELVPQGEQVASRVLMGKQEGKGVVVEAISQDGQREMTGIVGSVSEVGYAYGRLFFVGSGENGEETTMVVSGGEHLRFVK